MISGTESLLSVILGLGAGGVIGEFVEDFASIAVPVATIGAIASAAYAGFRDQDVARFGAIGGGLGLMIGLIAAVIDRVAGG